MRVPPWSPIADTPSGRDASIAWARCRIAFAAVRVAAMACNAAGSSIRSSAWSAASSGESPSAMPRRVATSPMRSSAARRIAGSAAFLTTSRSERSPATRSSAARRMPSCAAPLAIGISAFGSVRRASAASHSATGPAALAALDEDLLDSLDREIAQPAIGLGRRDPLEECDVAELPDRDPPNLRVRIRARDRRETVLLLGAHLAHRRRPHRGVGMTPPGPQSRDQIHGSCRRSSLPTPTWPCLWTIVLRKFGGVGYVK